MSDAPAPAPGPSVAERFTTFATLFPEAADAFIRQFEQSKRLADWAAANGHIIETLDPREMDFGVYERWAVALRKAKPKDLKSFDEASIAEWHGALLRTALACGIITRITPQGLTVAGVAAIKDPLVVRFYGEKLAEMYALVTQAPLP